MADTDPAPILVTGFMPFNGDKDNASWQAVRLLPEEVAGHPVAKLEVPCVFGESAALLAKVVRELSPVAVVLCGQAEGRTCLTIEEVAVNVERATIPDEAGRLVTREPVVAGGPDAYLSTMPLDECVAASRAAGVPAMVSDTAGRYVCNQLMYQLLHDLRGLGLDIPAGFVHVPCMPHQVVEKPTRPSMDSATASKGLLAMVEACLAR